MVSLSPVLVGFNAAEWGVEPRTVIFLSRLAAGQHWALGFHLEGGWLWFWFGRNAKIGGWGGHVVEDPVVEVEQRRLTAEWRRGWRAGSCGVEGVDAGLDGGRRRHVWARSPNLPISFSPFSNSAPTLVMSSDLYAVAGKNICSPSQFSPHLPRLLSHPYRHRRAFRTFLLTVSRLTCSPILLRLLNTSQNVTAFLKNQASLSRYACPFIIRFNLTFCYQRCSKFRLTLLRITYSRSLKRLRH